MFPYNSKDTLDKEEALEEIKSFLIKEEKYSSGLLSGLYLVGESDKELVFKNKFTEDIVVINDDTISYYRVVKKEER